MRDRSTVKSGAMTTGRLLGGKRRGVDRRHVTPFGCETINNRKPLPSARRSKPRRQGWFLTDRGRRNQRLTPGWSCTGLSTRLMVKNDSVGATCCALRHRLGVKLRGNGVTEHYQPTSSSLLPWALAPRSRRRRRRKLCAEQARGGFIREAIHVHGERIRHAHLEGTSVERWPQAGNYADTEHAKAVLACLQKKAKFYQRMKQIGRPPTSAFTLCARKCEGPRGRLYIAGNNEALREQSGCTPVERSNGRQKYIPVRRRTTMHLVPQISHRASAPHAGRAYSRRRL